MTPLEMIIDERIRQKSVHHYTDEDDDKQTDGQLANAAAMYAMTDDVRNVSIGAGKDYLSNYTIQDDVWPYEWRYYHSCQDRLHELAKAGGLILAEMERITRKRKAQ